MTRRALSAVEVEVRLPVWDAIADLFLDTVVDTPMLQRVADELARSPFSIDELRQIYLFEVAPVVHRNLKIVAGEWAGFGREWLRERIPAYLARGSWLFHGWSASPLGRRWHTFQTRADFQSVILQVAAIRAPG
ncbi:DUF7079 family protein [Longimicrobium sp.]|uniref:DUF7079 family protein n=1 Tax=Longimicrobium sp. TaxID=2029185 RepID=UPI003B3A9974